jgi:hypothetical protein
MKTTIKTFVCAMALSTTFAFANAEDKATAHTVSSLPAYVTASETPAPQKVKNTTEQSKYTPAQKASLTGLKLTTASK